MYNEATGKMQSSQLKLKTLFKCLSNPVFTLQAFLEAASEYHICSLLTMSENLDQDIDEATVDQLLRKWKHDNAVPKELKEYLKSSLKRWLPKTKIQERFRNYKKEADSDYGKKNR
ncbi:Hypothetical predicted protein [Paramuricea clavata]|uniref:Uncharacterized protein n=1 Tax=Paramuricea clavata TaxID=317549 RepID=A0A6S7KBD0_PARCT|nr:Hypothetical predicted protein [Paramuricea clavata]